MRTITIFTFLVFLSLAALSQDPNTRTKTDPPVKPLQMPKIAMAPPANVGFFAESNGGDFIAVPSAQVINPSFSNEKFDAANNFNNSTFTVPSDGFYHFDVTLNMETSHQGATMELYFDIVSKDGTPLPSPVKAISSMPTHGNYNQYFVTATLSASIPLKKGDKLSIASRSQGYGSATLTRSFFSGFKIF
jgi:hypothetical protein